MTCAGLADPEALAREIPDLDLDHPWDLSTGAGRRAGARLRGRRAGRRSAPHQLRRRLGQQPARSCACMATRTGSSPASPAPAIPSAARCSRSRARTCSATTGIPPRAIAADLEDAAAIGRRAGAARARATRRARAGDAARAGAVRSGNGARPDSGTSSVPSAARSQYRKPRSCSMRPGKQVFPDFLQIAGAAAHSARDWRAARSTRRAWPRAIATWSATGCCRAMCSAVTRRASWD